MGWTFFPGDFLGYVPFFPGDLEGVDLFSSDLGRVSIEILVLMEHNRITVGDIVMNTELQVHGIFHYTNT